MGFTQEREMLEREGFIEQAFHGKGAAISHRDHPLGEVITAYVADELDEAEAIEVAIHLSSCAECLDELSELRSAWESLTERLTAALPEPEQAVEILQKREIARRVRGFLLAHLPKELELFEEVWNLLSVKPLGEITLIRPQRVRDSESGAVCVALISTLAAILAREDARGFHQIPDARLREIIEHYGGERGLPREWMERLAAYLLG